MTSRPLGFRGEPTAADFLAGSSGQVGRLWLTSRAARFLRSDRVATIARTGRQLYACQFRLLRRSSTQRL